MAQDSEANIRSPSTPQVLHSPANIDAERYEIAEKTRELRGEMPAQSRERARSEEFMISMPVRPMRPRSVRSRR
jgi:hypothetical protein